MDFSKFLRSADQPETLPAELVTMRVLDAQDCAAIGDKARLDLGWYESMIAHDDKIGYDLEPEGRKSQSLPPAGFAEHFPGLHDRIAAPLLEKVKEKWGADFPSISGLHLIKYQEGGYFVVHTDSGTQFPRRKYSIICYIDQDYLGGETAFPSLEVMVKGRSGWVLIFPSGLLHSGMPIAQGTKLIAVGFLESDS